LFLYSALHDIPQDLRYLIGGTVNTVLMMVSLWMATTSFKHAYSTSTIYTVINLSMIPIGHAVSSLIVFGWPQKYIQNLCINAPIGLAGTFLGSILTELLDRIGFDSACYKVLSSLSILEESAEAGNMFTSILVMIITGLWAYILSNLVNGSSKEETKKQKKKAKGDKEL